MVNIPNVIWIDEDGVIVRPAEPGWPPAQEMPESMRQMMAARAKAAKEAAAADPDAPKPLNIAALIGGGQDRLAYPDVIRDWARNGAASPYAMTPEQVIAASQPRGLDQSRAAAHFELADHLWRAGERTAAIRHFDECHRLQPDNWTYKRQAWSLVGHERVGGELGRFTQSPLPGEEADWPFATTFEADLARLQPGEYYPKTL